MFSLCKCVRVYLFALVTCDLGLSRLQEVFFDILTNYLIDKEMSYSLVANNIGRKSVGQYTLSWKPLSINY